MLTDHGAYGPAGYVSLATMVAAWLAIRVLASGSLGQLKALKSQASRPHLVQLRLIGPYPDRLMHQSATWKRSVTWSNDLDNF
jgi:hypothetical protein